MLALDRENSEYLYLQVVDLISDQVNNGTLRAGDRLPSLRGLSDRLQVSIRNAQHLSMHARQGLRVPSVVAEVRHLFEQIPGMLRGSFARVSGRTSASLRQGIWIMSFVMVAYSNPRSARPIHALEGGSL